MELKKLLEAKMEREAAMTRKAVERVPEGRNDWKPHEKSMPFGYLAALVATMPGWAQFIIERDGFDLGDASNEQFRTKAFETGAELRAKMEESILKGRKAIAATTEEQLLKGWRFTRGGQVLYEAPRYIAIDDVMFSHLAHHRGQLTVYLRLNEVKVPALYGASADEQV